jgi:hypothetical protein
MILHRAVDAARRWADAHRELVIICVAFPLSTAATAWQNIKSLGVKRSAPERHDARLARVQAEVKRYAEARRRGEAWARKPLRTDRKPAASLNTRMADKSASQTVRMSDLTAILCVDRGKGIVRLEPFATVGDVAKHLDQMGLQLESTIEMKDATHVRMVYRPFYSLKAYADEYQRLVRQDEPPHFVETIIFGKDRAVIMEGHLAREGEAQASMLPVNPVNRS